MQCLLVIPGLPGSTSLQTAELPTGAPTEVLVRTLEIGVCGTDREIDAGRAGTPPRGRDRLIIGHEVLGLVETAGGGFAKGDLVAATVRRGCSRCAACARDESDACLTGEFLERGIHGLDGFAAELFSERPENLVPIPHHLRSVGVLAEPLSICERAIRHALAIAGRQPWAVGRALVLGARAIGALSAMRLRLAGAEVWCASRGPAGSEKAALLVETGVHYVSTTETPPAVLADSVGGFDLVVEATGDAGVAHSALETLGRNGVLCLLGVDSAARQIELDSRTLGADFVTQNKAVFGSVNAQRQDWEQAIDTLGAAHAHWPEVVERVIGLRVTPERFKEAFEFSGIKATIRFA